VNELGISASTAELKEAKSGIVICDLGGKVLMVMFRVELIFRLFN
jgi:hypothetical protein